MSSPGASYAGFGLGGAELGYGLSMNPNLNLTNPMTELEPDQMAISKQMAQQQGLSNQYQNQLQDLYGQQGNAIMSNYINQLSPEGSLGKQMIGEFNNYGITPQSGAFQEGLANALTQQQGNLMNQQLTAQLGGLQSNYGTQSGLGQTGLQNILGLQSQGVNTQNAQNLANFMQQAELQKALVSGGSSTMGKAAGGGGK